MSFQSNEFAYAKEFAGNLRGATEPVQVQLTTRLRVMTEDQGTAIREHSVPGFDRPPQYVFGKGSLPVAAEMQANGRHYFTW